MDTLLIFVPLLLSLIIGNLIVSHLFSHTSDLDPVFLFFLGAGVGLGVSSQTAFYSFWVLDGFHQGANIAVHLMLLLALLLHKLVTAQKANRPVFSRPRVPLSSALCLLALILAMIPVWLKAQIYPLGGWDAWSCWNLKARFLFEGGEQWKNMFDPVLWRSSPHYPLLLPLTNVWAWCFSGSSDPAGPMIVSLLFTFLLAGLFYSGVKSLTRSPLSLGGSLLLLTLPFYVLMAISQYSDLVLSFYLLASLICLTAHRLADSRPQSTSSDNRRAFLILAGIFLGFLSFTKPEGTIAALLVALLSALSLFIFKKPRTRDETFLLAAALCAFIIAFLPTLIFKLVYSPGNQTFVNGFLSADKPVTKMRSVIIFVVFFREFVAGKWSWIWIILLGGLVLNWRRSFAKEIRIVPVFLFSYLAVILFFYHLNTHFEIKWWLGVSLHRILFSLLPIALFWVFFATGGMKTADDA